MSTTIETPPKVLEKSEPATKPAEKSRDQIMRELEEFARQHDQSKLIPLLGTSDGFMSLEELEEMRAMD